jgi:hypothetical protein
MNRPKTSQVGDFEAKTATALGLGYSPQEQGVTVRPSSSSLFCISSADRYSTIQDRRDLLTSPYRFTITKNESLLNGFLSRLALTEVKFNWNLPNVLVATGTNTIQITSGAVTALVTVPEGFYTPKELGIYIESSWNTDNSGSPILLTYLESQGYYTLQANIATPNDLIAIAPNPAITTNTKQLYDMMNWAPGSQIVNRTTKNSGIVNLRWTEYIDIVCNQLTYNQDLKDTSSQRTVSDMLCRVYLDESVPSDASYMAEFSDDIPYQVNPIPPPVPFPAPKPTPLWEPYVPVPDADILRTPLVGYGGRNNGCRPCVIYRQFATPKYINWNRVQPVGQVQFEILDDQGRCLADYIPANLRIPQNDWNITLLASEQ